MRTKTPINDPLWSNTITELWIGNRAPIHYQIKTRSDLDIILEFGPSISLTPLMAAARDQNLEECRSLIKNGADVNSNNEIGETAMDFIKNQETEAYKILFKAGSLITTDHFLMS